MSEPNKPAWVTALDKAQAALEDAAKTEDTEQMDAKTRLAYGWMDVARMLKDPAPTYSAA